MSVRTHLPRSRLVWGAVLLAAIAVLFVLVSPYLSLEHLESQRLGYLRFYDENPLVVVVVYIVLAAFLMGAALPVTGLLLLLGGALFGFWVGLLASSIAATTGATIGFFWSRYFFRDVLRNRFRPQFEVINRGIGEEGAYYVFSMRLLMVFPYFLLNLLCGLTDIRSGSYVIATLSSQLIVGSVWVYAGTQLASIDSGSDVLSLNVFVALALIGLTPLVCRRILNWVRGNRRRLRDS